MRTNPWEKPRIKPEEKQNHRQHWQEQGCAADRPLNKQGSLETPREESPPTVTTRARRHPARSHPWQPQESLEIPREESPLTVTRAWRHPEESPLRVTKRAWRHPEESPLTVTKRAILLITTGKREWERESLNFTSKSGIWDMKRLGRSSGW